MTSTNAKDHTPAAARRSRRFKILFILGINLVLLLVAYIFFIRVTERYIAQQDASRLIYDFNPLRRQVLLPNQQYRLDDVHFSINELGTRGNAPRQPKPDGATRIVVMGGSSVFDHHLSEGESWPERLGPLLSLNGLADVESFNCGIPGYSSRETLSFYIDRIRYWKPDYVLFYHGWNDLKYIVAFKDGVDADAFFYPTDFYDHNKMFKSGSPVRNWYAMQAMYRDWRDAGAVQENAAAKRKSKNAEAQARAINQRITPADVDRLKDEWSKTPGMDYFKRDVEMFVQAVAADGETPVLIAQNTLATLDMPQKLRKKIGYKFVHIDHAELLAINEAMIDVLRLVAEAHGTPFIDLRSEMNGRAAYFRDHVHMSPEGSHAFSDRLASKMAAIMNINAPRQAVSPATRHNSNVVGHWPCDKIDAARTPDVGPSGLHGRIHGRVDITPEGHEGAAFVLNGADSEMVVDDAPVLHLDDSFHIEAWVKLKPESLERESMGLVIKGGEYYLVLQHGKPAFYGYGLKPKGWQVAAETVPLDRWTRIAASYDGKTLRLMIDDREVLTIATSGRLDTIDSPLTIGGLNGPFLGTLDEVRIYRCASPPNQAE